MFASTCPATPHFLQFSPCVVPPDTGARLLLKKRLFTVQMTVCLVLPRIFLRRLHTCIMLSLKSSSSSTSPVVATAVPLPCSLRHSSLRSPPPHAASIMTAPPSSTSSSSSSSSSSASSSSDYSAAQFSSLSGAAAPGSAVATASHPTPVHSTSTAVPSPPSVSHAPATSAPPSSPSSSSSSPTSSSSSSSSVSVSEQQLRIQRKLQETLQPQHLFVVDRSGGCGAAFDCTVVATAFEGKPLLQRHRMVNGAIQKEIEEIHAFSLHCHTPAEWEKLKTAPH